MLFLDFNLAVLLGFILFFFSIYYYIVIRLKKSSISKDIDILYSSLLLFTSGILIFQGWRLDPILLFGQFLISSLLVATLIENISLRNNILGYKDIKSENIFDNVFPMIKRKNIVKKSGTQRLKKNPRSWVPMDWEDIEEDKQKIKDIDFF